MDLYEIDELEIAVGPVDTCEGELLSCECSDECPEPEPNKYWEVVNRTWEILPFWFKVKICLVCMFYAWHHYFWRTFRIQA